MSAAELAAAARRGAGVFLLDGRGLLEVSGSDRKRFLQGQLSNDVASLDPAGPRAACYALALTREGRIVADFLVVARPDRHWLETDAGSAAAAAERLAKYVIADDVAIADRSAETARLAVEGPRAGALVARAAGVSAAPGDGAAAELAIGGAAVVAVGASLVGGRGVQLFTPRAAADAVLAALRAAGECEGGVVAGRDALEVLRVEAGVPRAGAEIGPDTLPAELHLLERAVSFTKGCYTGQEVVARMHSRGRVGHLLVGLVLEAGEPPAPHDPITAGTARIGEVTSAVRSPAAGVIALGIVRRGSEEPGTAVAVGGRPARVVALPFVREPLGS